MPPWSKVPGSVGSFTWNGLWGTYFWVDPAEQLGRHTAHPDRQELRPVFGCLSQSDLRRLAGSRPRRAGIVDRARGDRSNGARSLRGNLQIHIDQFARQASAPRIRWPRYRGGHAGWCPQGGVSDPGHARRQGRHSGRRYHHACRRRDDPGLVPRPGARQIARARRYQGSPADRPQGAGPADRAVARPGPDPTALAPIFRS